MRKLFPNATIDLWCKSHSVELVKYNPHIDNIIIFDNFKIAEYEKKTPFALITKIKFLITLRKKKYDVCIDLTSRYFTAIYLRMAKIKFTLGYNYQGFEPLYSKSVDIKTASLAGHLSDKYLKLVKIGFDICDHQWNQLKSSVSLKQTIYIPDSVKDNVNVILKERFNDMNKPLIVIHCTAGWKEKMWAAEKFSELVDKIIQDDNYNVILIGSENETSYLRAILDNVNSFIYYDAIANFSTLENAEIVRRASVFVGADSMPLHIAGLFGTPSIGLFGPTNPKFSNPIGENHFSIYKSLPCSAELNSQYCKLDAGRLCNTIKCMKEISVDEVYNKINEILKKQVH